MDDSTYLVHHGIMGMKWGIRRFQNRDGSLTSLGKSRQKQGGSKKERASNAKKEVKARKQERRNALNDVSLMSDAELDRRIRRLEKERRFKELAAEDLSPGKKYANDVLKDTGKQVVKDVAKLAATLIVKELVSEALSSRKQSKETSKKESKIKRKNKESAKAYREWARDFGGNEELQKRNMAAQMVGFRHSEE